MQKYLTTIPERAAYGGYFLGQNVFYWLVTMFLLPYFTDVGIPAITVAGIALAVKVWDAVNDPIFGGLVDKIRFKKGKFLPWLRISLIFIPLATILLFGVPVHIAPALKIVWVTVAYILWDMAYTICDMPVFGLVTTMTDRLHERVTLITIGRIAASAGTFVITVGLPIIRGYLGGWLPVTIILSITALLFMAPLCFAAKERVEVRKEESDVSFKDMFRFLVGNKYMLIYFGAFILARAFDVGGVLNLYYARYNLGGEQFLGIMSMICAVPSLVCALLVPMLCKRIDKFVLFYACTIANIIVAILSFFAGYSSFPILVVFAILRTIPSSFLGVLMFMFTPDCVEYGAYKTGVNASGIAFALQTFAAKLVAALSSVVAALSLSFIGFVEGADAVQREGFASKFFLVYLLLPALGNIIALPLLSRYKLRDKAVVVMSEYNTGKISRDEAEQSINGVLSL
jgi:probable glucitol transport protein GutA